MSPASKINFHANDTPTAMRWVCHGSRPAFPLRRFVSIANVQRRNSLAVVKRVVAARCSTALKCTALCSCAITYAQEFLAIGGIRVAR